MDVARFDPAANGGQGGWVALGGSLSAGGISGDGTTLHPVITNTSSGPVVAWLDSSGGAVNVYVKQFVGGNRVAMGTGAASGLGISCAQSGVADQALATDGTKVAAASTQVVG